MSRMDFTGKLGAVPTVFQSESAECGLACICMLLANYRHEVSLAELRRTQNISVRGITLLGLCDISRRVGLLPRPLRVEIDYVRLLRSPAILHWGHNHFVVYNGTHRDGFHIIDPALGERIVSESEFSNKFTGILIEISPSPELVRLKRAGIWKDFSVLRGVAGLPRAIFLTVALGVIAESFALIAPALTQQAMDAIVSQTGTGRLRIIGLTIAALAVISGVVSWLRGGAILNASLLARIGLGNQLMDHVLSLPYRIFLQRPAPDFLARFMSVSASEYAIGNALSELLLDLSIIVVVFAVMFTYNPLLSLIAALTASLIVAVKTATITRSQQINRQMLIESAKNESNLLETVRGMQTVVLTASQTPRYLSWSNGVGRLLRERITLANLNDKVTSIQTTLVGIDFALILFIGGTQVESGDLSVGGILAFLLYRAILFSRLPHAVEMVAQVGLMSSHLERVREILEEPVAKKYLRIGNVEEEGSTGIKVNKINFRFGMDCPNLLTDISFSIAPGEHVAIIGASGSGKSTLIRLMCRLFEPTSGEINYFGTPGIVSSPTVGATLQDDVLFDGTIFENLTLFREDYDAAHVIDCCTKAEIKADIESMPMQYHTLVGEMGSALSAGQRQRLLLARSLTMKPSILFLDEATSNVDVLTEANILRNLKTLGITIVSVAHRPEAIRSASRILILDHAGIKELDRDQLDSILYQKGTNSKIDLFESV